MPVPVRQRPALSRAVLDAYEAHAEAADLPTATLIDAVLRGALRTGQVDRLSHLVLADEPVRRRARTVVRRWRNTRPTGASDRAPVAGVTGEWVSDGGWTLRRDRPTHGGHREGQWFLFGPGLPEEGWPTGSPNRSGAERAADAQISRLEAAAPVEVEE